MNLLPPPLPEEQAAIHRQRDESRSRRAPIIVGIIGTLAFHLIVIVAARHTVGLMDTVSSVPSDLETMREKYDRQQLNILLSDPEPPPQPLRFVEINPEAPDNTPLKTINFGKRNQQAAQPEAGPDHNDLPKTKGEEKESTAIVTGIRSQPEESLFDAGNNGQQGAGQRAVVVGVIPAQAQDPLMGIEKVTGNNPQGIGTNVGKNPDGKPKVEEHRDGAAAGEGLVVVGIIGDDGAPGAPGRQAPKPRPKVPNVRSAVLADQPLSASRVGVIGVDAKFSAFGDYLQELVDTVDAQFQKLCNESKTAPPPHSIVAIKFKLTSAGEVEILKIEGDDKAGRVATYICLDAIQARAPYRPWTKDMVAVLGTQQDITFSFHYL